MKFQKNKWMTFQKYKSGRGGRLKGRDQKNTKAKRESNLFVVLLIGTIIMYVRNVI